MPDTPPARRPPARRPPPWPDGCTLALRHRPGRGGCAVAAYVHRPPRETFMDEPVTTHLPVPDKFGDKAGNRYARTAVRPRRRLRLGWLGGLVVLLVAGFLLWRVLAPAPTRLGPGAARARRHGPAAGRHRHRRHRRYPRGAERPRHRDPAHHRHRPHPDRRTAAGGGLHRGPDRPQGRLPRPDRPPPLSGAARAVPRPSSPATPR